jgi:peptidyl-Lys metalloendopeptidase
LGPGFFAAPLVGRDSKAGTLIHELSHIEVGTQDYAYGAAAVLSLPSDEAANNADTYEYYAEDSYTILYGFSAP